MSYAAKGFAKAETPFGPLAGHTHITISDQGNDSAILDFRCGHTPVRLVVAGANYLDLVRALIDKASPARREELNERLDHVLRAAV